MWSIVTRHPTYTPTHAHACAWHSLLARCPTPTHPPPHTPRTHLVFPSTFLLATCAFHFPTGNLCLHFPTGTLCLSLSHWQPVPFTFPLATFAFHFHFHFPTGTLCLSLSHWQPVPFTSTFTSAPTVTVTVPPSRCRTHPPPPDQMICSLHPTYTPTHTHPYPFALSRPHFSIRPRDLFTPPTYTPPHTHPHSPRAVAGSQRLSILTSYSVDPSLPHTPTHPPPHTPTPTWFFRDEYLDIILRRSLAHPRTHATPHPPGTL